jgi:hypothetical protein
MKKLKTKKRGHVICDQCGYEIKDPVFASRSPTRQQMRCSVKNGRPGQKIMYGFSECQVKFNNKSLQHFRKPTRKYNNKTRRGGIPIQRHYYDKDKGNDSELIKRICLGVLCQGEKTFMSESVHNRVCIPCTNIIRSIRVKVIGKYYQGRICRGDGI